MPVAIRFRVGAGEPEAKHPAHPAFPLYRGYCCRLCRPLSGRNRGREKHHASCLVAGAAAQVPDWSFSCRLFLQVEQEGFFY
jgi:hypothetical protein